MPKGERLTIKQKRFVKEYVKDGNGTQAALKTYDTDKPEVAAVIADENLKKPNVKEAIEQALVKLELTPEWVLSQHKWIAENRMDEVMAQERALENIGKIANLYPSAKTDLELSDGKLKITWGDE
jgi:phage terminase small subunit